MADKAPGTFTVRLNKPWKQFTPAERKAFLDAVAGKAFPAQPQSGSSGSGSGDGSGSSP